MARSRSLVIGLILVIALIFISAFSKSGVSTPKSDTSPSETTQSVVTPSPFASVTYEGVEGKTAFDLLKESHQVDSQQYDFGVMVKSIDGKASDASKYWLYYVNGEQPSVGADKYETKAGDTIEWRLEPAQ